jgi:signal transduction histidine kinase
MKVGQRLFLAVIPAVLGVCAVAALAYWGQYARSAPEALIIVAMVASLVSLAVAWRNTRYVAQRIELLAARVEQGEQQPSNRDELDDIERHVRDARAEATRQQHAAEQRAAAYDRLLDEVLRVVPARLEESQLPLHILLENAFGELNDNQEELLGAAQSAVETADIEVRRLRKLLELERGAVTFTIQPVGVPELLRPPLAIAAARAEKRGVNHEWNVAATLPRVLVDLSHVQEALTSALGRAIDRSASGETISVRTDEAADGSRVTISIAHGTVSCAVSSEDLLAQRTIELQGGALRDGQDVTTIELPAERLGRSSIAPARTSDQRG